MFKGFQVILFSVHSESITLKIQQHKAIDLVCHDGECNAFLSLISFKAQICEHLNSIFSIHRVPCCVCTALAVNSIHETLKKAMNCDTNYGVCGNQTMTISKARLQVHGCIACSESNVSYTTSETDSSILILCLTLHNRLQKIPIQWLSGVKHIFPIDWTVSHIGTIEKQFLPNL